MVRFSRLRLYKLILAADIGEYLNPLWIGGLALAVIRLGIFFVPFQGETKELCLYGIVGVVVPFLAIGLQRPMSVPSVIRRAIFLSKTALIIFLFYASIQFIAQNKLYYVFVLGTVTTVFMYSANNHYLRDPVSESMKFFLCWSVVTLSWTAMVQLVFWDNFYAWAFNTPLKIIGFAVFLIFVCVNLRLLKNPMHRQARDSSLPTLSLYKPVNVWDWFVFSLFLLFALRNDNLFDSISFYHWSYYTGVIESIKQGGLLLWDTPSQYGFLNVLAMATIPANAWQVVYSAQGIAFFFTAVFIYLLSQSLFKRNFLTFLFSFVLSLTAVFLIPGRVIDVSGPQAYPSAGPIRFLWCYILLGIVFWSFLVRTNEKKVRRIMGIGNIAWLLGFIWSAESSFFASAIWFPAYIITNIQLFFTRQGNDRRERIMQTGSFFLRLCIPFFLLLAVIGVIYFYYRIFFGITPDFGAFYDFAKAFSAGFGALPIMPFTSVWILLLFFLLPVLNFTYILWKDLSHPAIALLASILATVWSISSYFVSRSHSNAVNNLFPLLVLVLLILFFLNQRYSTYSMRLVLMAVAIPFFTTGLLMSLRNPFFLRLIKTPVRLSTNIAARLPVSDTELLTALKEAKVSPSDPIVYNGPFALMPAWSIDLKNNRALISTHSWLPKPLHEMISLSEDRCRIYLHRFIERSHLSGWLIQRKDLSDEDRWFIQEILKTHRLTLITQTDNWAIFWCELARKL